MKTHMWVTLLIGGMVLALMYWGLDTYGIAIPTKIMYMIFGFLVGVITGSIMHHKA